MSKSWFKIEDIGVGGSGDEASYEASRAINIKNEAGEVVSVTVNIWSTPLALYYLNMLYGERSFLVPDGVEPLAQLHNNISYWLEANGDNAAHAIYAMSAAYDPLANVDGVTTVKETTDITPGVTDTVERTPINKTVTTDTGVFGFNSSELVPSSREVVTDAGSEKTETSHTGKDTHETDRTETRHGNIGVTMTTQLINAEIDLRLRPLVQDLFKACIDSFSVYI